MWPYNTGDCLIEVFVQNEIDNKYCDGDVHVNDIDSLVVN